MTHVSTQTTLSNSIALEQRLYSLDLESVAAWYAFELATTVAAPVSTGTLLSQHLFNELIAFGIMREAYTEERITRRALYEASSWAYPRTLQCWYTCCNTSGPKLCVRQRKRLGNAEVHTYLCYLLRRLVPTGADVVLAGIAREWLAHALCW